MYKHRLGRFDRDVLTIHPGEYYVTREDMIIATVLGSCIAVALYDPNEKAGGLNHFMLPGVMDKSDLIRNPNAKYGMYAMELLVNELMRVGLEKRHLKAKVFGGASVIRLPEGGSTKIPRSNIDFAFEYLAKEDIPIVSSDVGGKIARKILFFPRDGKILLKRIGSVLANLVEKDEEHYLDSLRAKTREGPIVLFDPDDPAPKP